MDKLKIDSPEVKAQIDLALMKALSVSMTNLVGTTMKNCPIKTGKLVSSISKTFQKRDEFDMSGVVFTDVEYSKYVEFGTKKQRAQHFMRDSLYEEWDSIMERFRNIF